MWFGSVVEFVFLVVMCGLDGDDLCVFIKWVVDLRIFGFDLCVNVVFVD